MQRMVAELEQKSHTQEKIVEKLEHTMKNHILAYNLKQKAKEKFISHQQRQLAA